MDSAGLIRRARAVFGLHLDRNGLGSSQPAGVILQRDGGRVVFKLPTLLPDEVFVPADWLLGNGPAPSSRPPRQRLTQPCPIPQS